MTGFQSPKRLSRGPARACVALKTGVPSVSHNPGEGGNQRVSCMTGQCCRIISLERYTRYRFTVPTLRWHDENGFQTLSENFDAQDQNGHAQVTVTL